MASQAGTTRHTNNILQRVPINSIYTDLLYTTGILICCILYRDLGESSFTARYTGQSEPLLDVLKIESPSVFRVSVIVQGVWV